MKTLKRKSFFIYVITSLLLYFCVAPFELWAAQRAGSAYFQQDVRAAANAPSPIDGEMKFAAVAPMGDVFVATERSIYRRSGDAWMKMELPREPQNINAMTCGPDGTIWIAADGFLASISEKITVFDLKGKETPHFLSAGAEDLLVGTSSELYRLRNGKSEAIAPPSHSSSLTALAASPHSRDIAVMYSQHLFFQPEGQEWMEIVPRNAKHSWSWPETETTFIAFDASGSLWFATSIGAGCYDPSNRQWTLYDGNDGLPYNEFTCLTPGWNGEIWFGTKRGAIRFQNGEWSYRSGQRWLPGDEVRTIGVNLQGVAWIVTNNGLGVIERKRLTFEEKAAHFETLTNERHVRYGYVSDSRLRIAGDLNSFELTDSDNDGLWTAMYGAGECFRYAATKDPQAKALAKRSFEALKFLSGVTGIPGFPARTILPTSGPDPNEQYTPEKDRRAQNGDPLWKVMNPRWPKSADGKWYWKCDTSSDETDGHYFFYAAYYDLAAETPEEKKAVVEVVRAITDHFLRNNYCLVDHDGKPTRWAVFNPENLNCNILWWEERGLNSLSMLSYLKVAEHVTGDPKYADAAKTLIDKHGYAQNVILTKTNFPKECINHSDDEMAFMCYYNLLKYEKDPDLKQYYLAGLERSWRFEIPERNPLFNFIYGAVSETERFGRDDAIDTLQRIPLDFVTWKIANSHRLDITPQPAQTGAYRERAASSGGGVLPIDESPLLRWNGNPFQLDGGNGGYEEEDGAFFLLPYWLGRYHGFIEAANK
ncbi:MAG: hypothetical protein AB1656_18875 [Candidatus Omnitrophota bacterium]